MMVIDTNMTISKAKTATKEYALEVIKDALIAKYGEENVAMVRKPDANDPKKGTNYLAAVVDEVEVNGEVYPICVGVTVAAKDPVDRVIKSGTIEAFDFVSYKENYDRWVEGNEAKKVEAAKKKQMASTGNDDDMFY